MVNRYKSPYEIPAPEWATEIAFDMTEEGWVGGVQTWWFINKQERIWSHYNSEERYPTDYTGFGRRQEIRFEPVNLTLENE